MTTGFLVPVRHIKTTHLERSVRLEYERTDAGEFSSPPGGLIVTLDRPVSLYSIEQAEQIRVIRLQYFPSSEPSPRETPRDQNPPKNFGES